MSPEQMSLMFDKWARRINERRNPDAPKLSRRSSGASKGCGTGRCTT
jgi:hypothetical protein